MKTLEKANIVFSISLIILMSIAAFIPKTNATPSGILLFIAAAGIIWFFYYFWFPFVIRFFSEHVSGFPKTVAQLLKKIPVIRLLTLKGIMLYSITIIQVLGLFAIIAIIVQCL